MLSLGKKPNLVGRTQAICMILSLSIPIMGLVENGKIEEMLIYKVTRQLVWVGPDGCPNIFFKTLEPGHFRGNFDGGWISEGMLTERVQDYAHCSSSKVPWSILTRKLQNCRPLCKLRLQASLKNPRNNRQTKMISNNICSSKKAVAFSLTWFRPTTDWNGPSSFACL